MFSPSRPVCLLLAGALYLAGLHGPQPARGADTPLSAEQKQRLAEVDKQAEQLAKLRKDGQLAAAIELAEKLLAAEIDVLGSSHDRTLDRRDELADLHVDKGDFAAARRVRAELLDLQTRQHGAKDYRVTDARLQLAHVELVAKMTQAERDKLGTASRALDEFFALNNKRQYAAALPLIEKTLALRLEVLGKEHMLTAQAAIWAGWLQQRLGQLDKAEPLLQLAVDSRKQVLGDTHPELANALITLADVYEARRQYQRAEPLHLEALRIRKETQGVKHSQYLLGLHNLAVMYSRMGQYPKAIAANRALLAIHKDIGGVKAPNYLEELDGLAFLLGRLARTHEQQADFTPEHYEAAKQARQEVLAINIQLHGDQHWEVTNARHALVHLEKLNSLKPEQRAQIIDASRLMQESQTLRQQDKYREALAPTQKALALYRQVLGAQDLECASCLVRLALLHDDLNELAQAATFYQQAMAIRKQALGEDHPDYGVCLNNLAFVYRNQGAYAQAEPLYKAAVELQKRADGENSPGYATCLNNLADLYDAMGNFKAAEPLYLQALEIRKHALGERDPDYASSLHNLASFYRATGSLRKAEPLFLQALEIRKAVLGEKHPRYAASLNGLGVLYDALGELAKAEKLLQQALDLRKQVLGEDHPDYANSLHNLAGLYEAQGKFHAAEKLYVQALDLKKKIVGDQHVDYATSLSSLAHIYDSLAQYDKAETLYQQARTIRKQVLGDKHPEYAQSLNGLANLYFARAQYDKALPLYEQAAQIYRDALGEQHSDFSSTLNNLANVYKTLGQYDKAEPLFLQVLKLRRQALGAQHPLYADSLNKTALLYLAMGDPGKAETFARQALDIFSAALGTKHIDYSHCLNNLGLIYTEKGDFAQAERCYREAQQITREVRGEEHLEYATSLHNLAGLLAVTGDHVRAEPLYRQALDLRRRLLGEKHEQTIHSLNNLSLLYTRAGDFARAEPLGQQALALQKELLGENHPHYAVTLNNLALLYANQGEFARAETLYLQSQQINKKLFGDKHLYHAINLSNLGQLYLFMGENERSVAANGQSIALFRELVGDQHIYYATALSNQAVAYARQGDLLQAEPRFRQALATSRRALELASAGQSERQQRAMSAQLRFQLNAYLSVISRAKLPGQEAYRHVLPWKGSVLRRQAFIRLERDRPELAAQFAELESVTGRLAALAYALPERVDQQARAREIAALTERKEQLEADLARQGREFRREEELAQVTPEQIQAALPPRSVLVDLFEYNYSEPVPGKRGELVWERRLAAFVVPRQGSIVFIDCGKLQPIEAAIEAWRKHFGISATEPNPGQELRRLVWDKLAPHLEGATAVLISPDGATARFPWAALPGRQADRYLLEDLAVVVVPVPQQLPEIFARGQQRVEQDSLLLVGGVDFDKAPPAPSAALRQALLALGSTNGNVLQLVAQAAWLTGTPAQVALRSAPAGGLRAWPELAGTRTEVDSIQASFRRRFPAGAVIDLQGAQPTRAALVKQAPHHGYLHLATHGFFAPKELRSALATSGGSDRHVDLFARSDVTGFHPGLLSGLVLVGANRAVGPDEDNGILTALEVAELDLRRTDLVVLSACETGLGEVAGGEGLLGLQRAFQTAGAHTTIASLWSVDDAATQKLMTRFYENLWQKKLPKVEALRQAQLSILYELNESSLPRGLETTTAPTTVAARRAIPRLWAAWVLSGDPGDLSELSVAATPIASMETAAPPAAGPGWLFVAAPLLALVLLGLAGWWLTRRVGAHS